MATLYQRIAAFNVENLFVRKREPGPKRTVFVNEPLPADYHDHKGRPVKDHVYTTNQVITSKYTVITFLPRNLLEQFRRVANVFFLGIAILQFFPKFSTISPGLVIFPLLVVLGITAAKDAYEDVKRHQSDSRVNRSTVRVLSGGGWDNPNLTASKARNFLTSVNIIPLRFKKRKSNTPDVEKAENVPGGGAPPQIQRSATNATTATGDVEFDESVPKEHRGLHLFGHSGHTAHPYWKKRMWEDVRVGDFVKILDGESLPSDVLICATSEEENVAFVETKNLDGETNLKSRNAVQALTHLNSANACRDAVFSVDCERPDNNMFRLNAAVRVEDGEGERQSPVDISMTLLRGTVLRNTGWVIGLVLFTGEDSKIVLNSGGTPSKRSKVERQMNPQVFVNLIILACMAVACAIVDSVLEHRDYPRNAPWLFADDQSDDNPSINGLITWAYALITFQNIIPISLYISIEFVRTCQALFIYFDADMYHQQPGKEGQATLARSWNLSDDLGQIEYIFSDKTGTLTQNKMIFRECSVNGKVYAGDEVDPDPTPAPPPPPPPQAHLAVPAPTSDSGSGSSTPTLPPAPAPLPTTHFSSAALSADIATPPSSAHARALHGFFSVLALCHTVLTSTDPLTGEISYKAQSPDEAALVRAAADAGWVFRGRDRSYGKDRDGDRSYGKDQGGGGYGEVLVMGTPWGEEERYELLNILEFTSARKRMGVVVRRLDGDGDEQEEGESSPEMGDGHLKVPGKSSSPSPKEKGKLYLLMKGADNVVFERLRGEGDEALRDQTEMHLSEFANGGLRTLTLAYRVVSESEYTTWSARYHAATVALEGREALIESAAEELEHSMRLLGATAIEDSLQDGVPETIADLKRAGIKVWVATGDKLETAIAIGHSTNLIGKESNIIVVRGGNRAVYDQMVGAVEEFFPESGILDDSGAVNPKELSLARTRSSRGGSGSRFGSGSGAGAGKRGGEEPVPLRRVETGISSIVGPGNGDRPGGFVLVIDGTALTTALGDEEHKSLLLRLAMLCEGVICCRVSPLQKALVVRLVKDGLGAMTLAIGDGANDVSMIQAADVGVGISGEEGLQAVNSSDYAIAQFRFLKKLLLVHGHWSYARNGNMILNFFYKNVVCIGVLWWFQIYCGWSANYAFDYTYLLFWNSFWTIAPVIAIGLFDRIIDSDVLMAIPELYRYGREGKWFGIKWFAVYMFDGVYQSAVVFFIVVYANFSPSARADGYDQHLMEWSTTMVFAAVFVANAYNGLNTNVWTGWVFFALALGIVLLWLFTVVYNALSPGWIVTLVYGNNRFLFQSPLFWLSLPITLAVSILPMYLAKAWQFGFAPNDIDILRYIRKHDPQRDLAHDAFMDGRGGLAGMRRVETRASAVADDNLSRRTSRSSYVVPPTGTNSSGIRNANNMSASRTDMSTGLRSVHRGFGFDTEEGGVAMARMQSNLSSRRNLAVPEESHGTTGRHLFSLRRGILKRKSQAGAGAGS